VYRVCHDAIPGGLCTSTMYVPLAEPLGKSAGTQPSRTAFWDISRMVGSLFENLGTVTKQLTYISNNWYRF